MIVTYKGKNYETYQTINEGWDAKRLTLVKELNPHGKIVLLDEKGERLLALIKDVEILMVEHHSV